MNQRNKGTRTQAGLTLVEAMVALAVLAPMLIGLKNLIGHSQKGVIDVQTTRDIDAAGLAVTTVDCAKTFPGPFEVDGLGANKLTKMCDGTTSLTLVNGNGDPIFATGALTLSHIKVKSTCNATKMTTVYQLKNDPSGTWFPIFDTAISICGSWIQKTPPVALKTDAAGVKTRDASGTNPADTDLGIANGDATCSTGLQGSSGNPTPYFGVSGDPRNYFSGRLNCPTGLIAIGGGTSCQTGAAFLASDRPVNDASGSGWHAACCGPKSTMPKSGDLQVICARNDL